MPQVRDNLWGWVRHFNKQVKLVRDRKGVALREMPLALTARGLFGRPNVDPVDPTEIEIGMPLLNTDTKSHTDIVSIMSHVDRMHVDAAAALSASGGVYDDGLFPAPCLADLIRIDVSDGQSFKLEGHQMKRNSAAHRNRVPVDGPMHAL
jgi:hypothetical protein